MARFRCRPYDQGHDDRQQFQLLPLVHTRAARTLELYPVIPERTFYYTEIIMASSDSSGWTNSIIQPARTANEDVEEIREIVDGMTYCAVTPEAPEWYLNPVFKTVLGAEDGVFESLCSDHPLFFADHFLRVLKDDAPPSLDFFRLLSSPGRGDKPIWGVYALVLEKDSCPTKLYIGSGTEAIKGVSTRLKSYENEDGHNIPELSSFKMASTHRHAELTELIDDLTWCALSASAPSWYINPIYKTHLAADIGTFEGICGQHPLKFSDNMYEVLMAKQPPTLDFFRTLPKPSKRSPVWGVYTLLLEKVDRSAKLYVGSGTNANQGVIARLRDYERETQLPQLVLKALQEGYTISHAGMLCWCKMPKPGQAPLARLRVVAEKATLAFVFFAGTPCQMDVLWETMLPWTRDEVAWEPLCTHTAFLEKPFGDLRMSEEELETYNAKRRAKALAQMKVNSRAFGEREKATSLEAYRARNNNRGRVHQHAKTTRTNAKNSQKWRCHETRNGTLRNGILMD
ncbi:hypothetical protein CKAH01_16078 [Colletotrichum kahawae]|uniref:GIY-YIG domain-containing protein n=1 Tax=Colletotrichum kahawae TaxID=34407 RepID=A0AAE0D998_COLKA|nr:hypothetical protein CKAH01_16078 [Colletotrichum kahawae]